MTETSCAPLLTTEADEQTQFAVEDAELIAEIKARQKPFFCFFKRALGEDLEERV